MHEIKFPFFKRDRILKIEMLENLRDFPREIAEIFTDNLSDGIVTGLHPKVDKEIITFSKGLVKYNNNIYLINDPTLIDYAETDVEVVLKLNFYEEIKDNDYVTQYVEVNMDENMDIESNQMELGRFKLKKGAYLRSDYKDLYDFTTEYNTINIVHVNYAGYFEPTISNTILKYFANEALQARAKNQIDINFCFLCLNSERIERKAIYHYIAYKEDKDIVQMTNEQIHTKLVAILNNIKNENSKSKRTITSGRKIIVD